MCIPRVPDQVIRNAGFSFVRVDYNLPIPSIESYCLDQI